MMAHERIFFPGLNILRFYAATAVVYEHFSQNTEITGLPHYPNLLQPLEYLLPSGRHAVTLFFVLSGFLITYLLLVEHRRTQTIDVQKFYIRRTLRIWPLYYLMVLIGFVALPLLLGAAYRLPQSDYRVSIGSLSYWIKIVLFLLMMPNVAFAMWGPRLPVGHLWSIGVEEQFYLLWPWLVHKFRHRVGWLIYAVILIKIIAITVVLEAYYLPGDHGDTALMTIYYFLLNWRIDCMAVGAFAAYMVFIQQEAVLRVLYSPVVKYGSALIVVLHVIFYDSATAVGQFGFSLVYAALIVNIAANPRPLFRFENRVTAFLGNISYGVYVYHFVILYLLLFLFKAIGYDGHENYLIFNLVYFLLGLGLTVLIAGLSYRYFETPFLKLKERFAIVASSATRIPSPPAPARPAASIE